MPAHEPCSPVDAIVERWRELCRWDPLLPPDVEIAGAAQLVEAAVAVLRHPQPLGWGVDPEIEGAVRAFAAANAPLAVTVEELVCLAEAARPFLDDLGLDAEAAWWLRNVVDRAIAVAVHDAVDHLQEEALTDHLTGLRNRRALQRDLRRELAGARRRGQPLTVVVLDLVGLKVVNDSQGHLAGDALIVAMAEALTSSLRRSDEAYRVGGDEFVVVAPGAHEDQVSALVDRVSSRAPRFGWGSATFPGDAQDEESLVRLADDRLIEARIRDRTPPRGASIDLSGTGRRRTRPVGNKGSTSLL